MLAHVLQNVSHQKVRLFGEAFAKVQEATGISDIDDLVKAFAAAEVSDCAYMYVGAACNGSHTTHLHRLIGPRQYLQPKLPAECR